MVVSASLPKRSGTITNGFQIAQDVPDDVWKAFEELVRAGYDRYLVDY
jgi:hypothetical protein